VKLLDTIKAGALAFIEDVKAAREPVREPTHAFAIKTPGIDEAIELEPERLFDHPPTAQEAVEEARRIALAYARKRTGKPELTWKQAKRLLTEWEKEERQIENDRRHDARERAMEKHIVMDQ
jgi:hypothetical protein